MALRGFFDLGFRPSQDHPTENQPQPPTPPPAAMRSRRRLAGGLVGIALAAIGCVALLVFTRRSAELAWHGPGGGSVEAPLGGFPVAEFLIILVGGALIFWILAALLHFLRNRGNELYWQIACWALVFCGIVARQLMNNGTDHMSHWALLAPAAVGLAILPALMRWLNKISNKPGLQHLAVPFSLGFFLDYAQTLTLKYGVKLPWFSG